MPRTIYIIYAVTSDVSVDDALKYLGEAEASSPQQAARLHLLGSKNEQPRSDPPKRIAVIPASNIHYMEPSVETQTRLRF